MERAMGLEPTTFSLGSWNGWGKARATLADDSQSRATSLDLRGQERTPVGARASADRSDRGSGNGAPDAMSSTPGFEGMSW